MTANPSLNGNVSLAEAGWNDQVDLIKTGARHPHEERGYEHVIEVKVERIGYRRGANKRFSGLDYGSRRPEPDAK
jgi:hypothetical protein